LGGLSPQTPMATGLDILLGRTSDIPGVKEWNWHSRSSSVKIEHQTNVWQGNENNVL